MREESTASASRSAAAAGSRAPCRAPGQHEIMVLSSKRLTGVGKFLVVSSKRLTGVASERCHRGEVLARAAGAHLLLLLLRHPGRRLGRRLPPLPQLRRYQRRQLLLAAAALHGPGGGRRRPCSAALCSCQGGRQGRGHRDGPAGKRSGGASAGGPRQHCRRLSGPHLAQNLW